MTDGRDLILLVAGIGLLAYAAWPSSSAGAVPLSGENVTHGGTPLDPATLAALAQQGSSAYGVRPELILADIMQESGGDPAAIGDGGFAIGLMQMHSAAAADVGVAWSDLAGNPELQVMAGTHYLALQIARFGDERTALIAYNQGASVAAAANAADPRYARGGAYADAVLARVPAAQAVLGSSSDSSSSPLSSPDWNPFSGATT